MIIQKRLDVAHLAKLEWYAGFFYSTILRAADPVVERILILRTRARPADTLLRLQNARASEPLETIQHCILRAPLGVLETSSGRLKMQSIHWRPVARGALPIPRTQ